MAPRNGFVHWREAYRKVFGLGPPDPVSGADVLAQLREYACASPEQTDCLVMDEELKRDPAAYHEHVARVRMYRHIQQVLNITDDQVAQAEASLRELELIVSRG